MSASRGLWLSALGMISLGSLCLAAPAGAQVGENPVTVNAPFVTDPNPLWRSPALIGMGELELGDDHSNRLTLWNFARNPVGIFEADSTSTVELRPGLGAAYADRITPLGEPRLHRQTLDGRVLRLGYEAFRRTRNGNAYGFYGDMYGTHTAVPSDQSNTVDYGVMRPGGIFVGNGKFPLFRPARTRFALRAGYLTGSDRSQYALFGYNPTGAYIGRGAVNTQPPDLFTPIRYNNTYLDAGGALSYRFGSWLTSAVGGDYLEQRRDGSNTSARHNSTTGEKRPYGLGQATLAGAVGPNFQWIADGRTWQASNQEQWVFSISAGIVQNPLAGRGLLLQRFESGTSLRTRARYTMGQFELGGQVDTYYQRVRIGAPDAGDRTSFNYFLNTIPERVGADSLVLPDSVRSDQTDQRNLDYGLGGFWHLPKGRGRLGVEYHWLRSRLDQLTAGARQLESWDVHTGAEIRCAPMLLARAGYVYRSWDADKFTVQNEFVTQTLTTGLGIMSPASRWDVEVGYAYEWGAPDYDDPYQLTGRRQQLAFQLSWKL